MRNDLTEVVLIVDESGSMSMMTSDTIGHINQFVKEQQEEPGEATFTLVFFDDRYRVIYDAVNLKNVEPITDEYCPRGSTALRDAVGKTINSVGRRLNKTKEKNRPSKVIFAILTDGEENSSREFSQEQLKEMITHQEEKYSWKFLFLAENINARATALNYGIYRSFQNVGGTKGYNETYGHVSNCVSTLRNTGKLDTDAEVETSIKSSS